VHKTWLWWSSGKDSAWALHLLRKGGEYSVDALVTSVNAAADRVAVHAVRRSLLEAQGEALGLPIHVMALPYPCPNEAYEAAATDIIRRAEKAGVTHMAFGDLFLEDVRAYREGLLSESGIECVFPLWHRDTSKLARDIVDAGVSAYLTCVDPKVLPPEFAGRRYSSELLSELPDGVDPCGENGEFHTFVSDTPDFAAPLAVELGERVERDGFWFADVLPVTEPGGRAGS